MNISNHRSYARQIAQVGFAAILILQLFASPVHPVFASASSAPVFDPINCADVTEIPQAECEALVALYNSTNGAGWTNNTNWLQTNTPCSWYGVYCGGGNVTTIYFDNNNLAGNIPPEIGNLSRLYMLVLTSNQLSGSIPPELGNLGNLQTLRLWHNHLTGSLPVEMGNLSNLQYFWLDDNEVSGTVPDEFGNLTGLRVLALNDNQFSGSLPPSLGNLVNLQYLNLARDPFTGNIPSSFGNLASLIELWLFETQISGTIPPEVGNLTALTKLGLHNNQLTGNIPTEIGNLVNLTHLSLSNNQMSGEIPVSITNLANLNHMTIGCGLTTSDPDVIAFLDEKVPGWRRCSGPRIRADGNANWISAYEWAAGTELLLTIDDASNGPGVDYSDSGVVLPGENSLEFDLGDFLLELNDHIVVSGNSITKELTFVPIHLTNIDLDQDTISGTTGPGVELSIWATNGTGGEGLRKVIADESGNWTANFYVAGPLPAEDLIVDITPETDLTITNYETDGDSTELYADIFEPGITFDPNSNSVYSEIFSPVWPLGTEVTVTIDDVSNGPGVDFSDTSVVEPTGNPGYNWVGFDPSSFPVEPPDIITMSGGSITKEFVMVPLSITDIDLQQDTVSGNGPLCERLSVWASTSQGEWGTRWITDDDKENWTADFSTAGPTSDEEFIVDITQGSHVGVDCIDEDGDYIELERIIPNPMFGARPGEDHVEGGDWPLGAAVTVQIDDPSTPENPDYSGNATVVIPDWNPNETRFDLDFGDIYDLKVGDVVTVTDGNVTKELVVTNFVIQDVDLDTDTAYGISEPDQVVNIWTCFNDSCVNREETADQDGHWTTNFSVPGDQDWEQDTADIRPGSWVDSAVWDQDGDGTMSGWSVLNPHIEVLDYIDRIALVDWPAGQTVHLSADDPSTGASPDYEQDFTPDQAGSYYDFIAAYDIHTGDIITATNGEFTKTLEVAALQATIIDPDNGTVQGVAAPNSQFDMDVWADRFDVSPVHDSISVDGSGSWSADYGDVPGNMLPWTWLIRGEMRQSDEDGDITLTYWHRHWGVLEIWMAEQEIRAYDWEPGATLTFSVNDPATSQPVDFTEEAQAVRMTWMDDGWAIVSLRGKFVLQPGMIVSVTDGTQTKSTIIQDIGFNRLDAGQDIAAGFAPAGANLDLTINKGYWSQRFFSADTNGNWLVDYTTPDPGGRTMDLQPGDPFYGLFIRDEEFDSTVVSAQVPNPSFSARLISNEVHGYNWLLGSSVTLAIDDPNTPEPVDYTDTQTVTVADWGPSQTFVIFRLGQNGFELQPDQVVTLTDGVVTKSHTVTHLTVTAVDPEADTVSGTADPGSLIEVGHIFCDDSGCHGFRRVAADDAGNWTADFAHVGEDEDEQDIIDIVPGTSNEARQPDADGDTTNVEWRVAVPRIDARPNIDEVETYDWSLGTILTLTIDDLDTPQNPDYTATGIVGTPSNPYDQSYFDFQFRGTYNLKAGDVITVTDGTTARQHTVTGLVLTSVDPVTNIVSGTAEPGSLVEIHTCDAEFNCGNSREETADQDGNWSSDFGAVDLQPGLWVDSGQRDSDGNWTMSGSPVYAAPVSDSDGDGQLDLDDPCPADPNNTCKAEGSIAGILGSEGGTLITENGKAAITVPTGALQDSIAFSITDMGSGYEISVFEGTMLVVHSYSIQPHGTPFDPPATITFTWEDADDDGVVDGTSLHESHLLLIKDGLVITPACAVNTNCDMAANRLTIEVSSLSLFALAAPVNQPPQAEAGPDQTAYEGTPLTLDASASSDPEAGPLTYEWDLDNDGEYDDASGVTTGISFADNGTFRIGLRVTDGGGLTDDDEVTLNVKNVPPHITSLRLPNLIRTGVTLNALATFRDPGVEDTFTSTWRWGDGTQSNGVVTGYNITGSHIYTRPGIYLVTVTLTDKDGGTERLFDIVIVFPRR